MLDENQRYCAYQCATDLPNGPSTWHVMDWDRRRVIAIVTPECQEDAELATTHLKRHISILPSDTYRISVSQDGELLEVSTDPRDDGWICIARPTVQDLQLQKPLNIPTISRAELLELSRVAPNLDLVSYSTRQEKKALFKYVVLQPNTQWFWSELNIWIRLPHHPNIVPIDRIVLDEIFGQIVGLTTLYVPGGTLEENLRRGFKLKWLEQLIQVVDDLNLKYGIIHGGILARNLLVDPETDDLLLANFSLAARTDRLDFDISEIDIALVILTVHSIITGDKSFLALRWHEQISNAAVVERLEEWLPSPGMILDGPVSLYRSAIVKWANRRRKGKFIHVHLEVSEKMDWPEFPYTVWEKDKEGASRIDGGNYDRMRFKEREAGRPILEWERPPENDLRVETSES